MYFRELMRMTSDLGAKLVRVFLGWPGVTLLPEGGGSYDFAKAVWKAEHEGVPEEQTWEWCRDSLAEASKLAGDFGVTLALQNHAPVIKGYRDTLRMVKEINSPRLKICLDARLEKTLDEAGVRKAINEAGALQVLWHFGGEYDRGPSGITLKGEEKALGGGAGPDGHRVSGVYRLRAVPSAAGGGRQDGRGRFRRQERPTSRRVHARHPGRGEAAAEAITDSLKS